MKQIQLDTSAYSAFRRGHRLVVHRIREAEILQMNAIVLGELRAGFRKGSRYEENMAALEQMLASPRVRLVDIDAETARRYEYISDDLRRRGKPIPTNDLWIAASAMQHGSLLLTTDSHFHAVPQILTEILTP